MKNTLYTLFLILVISINSFGRVHIIIFDCSGSFLGPKTPEILKNGSLAKVNDLVNQATYIDTIIFFSIRGNSTVSSLNQTILVKAKAKTVFDPTIKKINSMLIKNFVKNIFKEVNRPYAIRTDIISAVNYASAIAKNYNEASIYIFSDGGDNVNAKLFKRLDKISVYHLFIFDSNSGSQNKLVKKWESLYNNLGAKSVIVEGAQASMTLNIKIK